MQRPAPTSPPSPLIIGLTGSFGSGCSYVAKHILAGLGYASVSLSERLRQEYRSEKGQASEVPRRNLQLYGDELRKRHGPGYLAALVSREIREKMEKGNSTRWVIDSIRNPAEVHHFRQESAQFFLFGMYATKETRWQRVRGSYQGNRGDFDEDDEMDTGRRSDQHGQRVEDCFAEADVVFSNEEIFAAVGNTPFTDFRGRVSTYVDIVSTPLSRRQPTQREALMCVAYALSQRSSCLQRKVGAVIVDGEGDIISSGFNEVPKHYRPCREQFGKCGRTVVWDKFLQLLKEESPGITADLNAIADRVRRRFRILDECRALHAEENAIISLARNGRSVPLKECTLYTTTYPCRLCANKIVNLGLGRVVYLEPYPDEEAKVILEQGDVEDEFFEGVTFKGYSRVYGEKK